MPLTTGPLFSLDAKGTLAKTLTFSHWKGRSYCRERVIPLNPKAAKQSGVRSMLAFLAQAWAALSAPNKATYQEAATARAISTFNQYCSENLARHQLSKAPSQATPAAEATSACAITSAPLTGHEGYASAVVTPATNANIWGVMVFRDPAAITVPGWANCVAVIYCDDVTPFTFTDSPLDAGTYHYRFAAFNVDGVLGTVLADASVAVT
jgi:hypothetical protein